MLSVGFPGTAAGPLAPPSSTVARDVNRSRPLGLASPWHFKHLSNSKGRTSFSKNSMASGEKSSANAPAGSRTPSARDKPKAEAILIMKKTRKELLHESYTDLILAAIISQLY